MRFSHRFTISALCGFIIVHDQFPISSTFTLGSIQDMAKNGGWRCMVSGFIATYHHTRREEMICRIIWCNELTLLLSGIL